MDHIPQHLRVWTVEQKPELYTPIDHAAWRYVMRVSGSYFRDRAHPLYLDGLEQTGISRERIPYIHEMDSRMRKIGWRAVAVSGFIPPQVFMEFQSLGILPIACDMRQLDHLLYTPAPDVIHEAAGHAPIIADPDYSAYLRAYGEISRRAIFSKQDMAVYRAIRKLSEIKENPLASDEDVRQAEAELDVVNADLSWFSEAAELSRMYWWTVEYGLVGSLDAPRIYGAGLLSSAGESYRCLSDHVKKVHLDLSCLQQAYDITKPQPQLFVTPDFRHLMDVLNEYAETMAWKVGGEKALEKALCAEAPVSMTLDSGLQISGVLAETLRDDSGNLAYLQCKGPTMLGADGVLYRGHGRDTHAEGFGTAIGRIKGANGGAAELDGTSLRQHGFAGGASGTLEFESGVRVTGRLDDMIESHKGNRVIRFVDCRVTLGDRLLFDPAWGCYDMACGLDVVEVSGGWLDRSMDPEDLPGERPQMKCNLTRENRAVCPLYLDLRRIRELRSIDEDATLRLAEIADELMDKWPEEWLLRLELVELGEHLDQERESRLRNELNALAGTSDDLAELVRRGLDLC